MRPAKKYMHDVYAEAKAKPSIQKGMTVGVYVEGEFTGYGRIVDAWWSEPDGQYAADVLMYSGSTLEGALAENLKRGVWTKHNMSLGMLALIPWNPYLA
jgi:hypothetical protein